MTDHRYKDATPDNPNPEIIDVEVPETEDNHIGLMQAAEELNCSPEDIRFVRARGGLLKHRHRIGDAYWYLNYTADGGLRIDWTREFGMIAVAPVTPKEFEEVNDSFTLPLVNKA